MGLHTVVVVHEAHQGTFTHAVAVEALAGIPLLHERPDNPFGLAVGLGRADFGKALLNPGFATGAHEVMFAVAAFVLGAVVGQDALNGVGALTEYRLQEAGGTPAAFVRVDTSLEFTAKVVNGHKQVFSLAFVPFALAFEPRQAFGIQVEQLARVVFLVADGLLLELSLNAG